MEDWIAKHSSWFRKYHENKYRLWDETGEKENEGLDDKTQRIIENFKSQSKKH